MLTPLRSTRSCRGPVRRSGGAPTPPRGPRAGTSGWSPGTGAPTGSCAVAASSSDVTVARKSRTIATRPARASSTSPYDGVSVVKTDMSTPSSMPTLAQAEGVERLLELQDAPAQPRVGGQHQVAQRLRERPLTVHRDVDRARGHRCHALERGRPGALERRPGGAQAVRILGPSVGTPGKSPVQLGLDEGNHVDPVDEQRALAVEEPWRVDVGSLHLGLAHHDAGQVSPDEPGAAQVRVDELRPPQVVGTGERGHDAPRRSSAPSSEPPTLDPRRAEQRHSGRTLTAFRAPDAHPTRRPSWLSHSRPCPRSPSRPIV